MNTIFLQPYYRGKWMLGLLLLSVSTFVAAHPALTSAVFLDIQDQGVDLEFQIPVDQLYMAAPAVFPKGRAAHDRAEALALFSVLDREQAVAYLTRHIAIYLADSASLLPARVGVVKVVEIDNELFLQGVMHFLPKAVEPHADENTATLKERPLRLTYDAVVHKVVTHKAYISLRRDFNQAVFATAPQLLQVVRAGHTDVTIDRSQSSN